MEFLDVVNNWDEKSLQALYDNYYKALVGFSYTIVGSVDFLTSSEIYASK